MRRAAALALVPLGFGAFCAYAFRLTGDPLAWLHAQIRSGGWTDVTVTDQTEERFALGLWGPDARKVLSGVTRNDVTNEAFPYLTAQTIRIGDVEVFAQRNPDDLVTVKVTEASLTYVAVGEDGRPRPLPPA